jgi:hypothetical protein
MGARAEVSIFMQDTSETMALRPKDETLSNAGVSFADSSTYVVVGLVRAVGGKTEVVGLDGGHLGELDVKLSQVGTRDLLVEGLGEHVDSKGVLLVLGPESDLGKDLVGERARHDE